jgi:hypothetical protein
MQNSKFWKVIPFCLTLALVLGTPSKGFAYNITWDEGQEPHSLHVGAAFVGAAGKCRALTWGDSFKLASLSSEEFNRWLRLDAKVRSDLLRVVPDFIRPGELDAISDLVEFARTELGEFEDLRVVLEERGVRYHHWEQMLIFTRRSVNQGARAEDRRRLYQFMDVVREAREAHRAEVDQPLGRGVGAHPGIRLRVRFGDVELRGIVDPVQGFAGVGPFHGDRLLVQFPPYAAPLPADRMVARFWGDPEAFRALEAEGMRGLRGLVAAVLNFHAGHFEAPDADDEEIDSQDEEDGAHPPLSRVDRNLLIGLPFLRDLYTQGPGEDVIPCLRFRLFLCTHYTLVDQGFVHYMNDPATLETLRALPDVESREQKILQHFGLDQIECGDHID